MAETQERIRRQTAKKTRIAHIKEGKFVRREGWDPSYVLDPYGRYLVRINLMGAMVSEVSKDSVSSSFLVDDGTGQIQVRHFESQRPLPTLSTGDIVLIIGRVRIYNEEFYIIPEIVKRFEDTNWLKLRNREMQQLEETLPRINPEEEVVKEERQEEASQEHPAEEQSPSDRVYYMIKEKDTGDGVDVDDVIQKSGYPDGEKIISNLLLEGEIFEIRPGRVKVLD